MPNKHHLTREQTTKGLAPTNPQNESSYAKPSVGKPSHRHTVHRTMNLSELKRQLEEMLLDQGLLVKALQQLRDLLPEKSEKRVTVLALLGRLNDANKKALRDTIDDRALQVEYNAIRSDLSDLVQGLEEGDFDADAGKGQASSAKATAAKQGSVLYRIPHTMPLAQETECVVRIAIDEDAIVEEITLDDQVVLKDLTRVSDLMQVELGDPAKQPVFAIRSTSPAQQLVTEEGYTQWFFYVEPLRDGLHPLEVKVSVLEMAFNQIHRKELVFRETIQIYTAKEGGADAEEAPKASKPKFKNAGPALAFAGTATDDSTFAPPQTKGIESVVDFKQIPEPPGPAPKKAPSGNTQRNVALGLALLLGGSTATWALTPAATRDWWVASIVEDDAEAYAAYIEKHPDSPYREKAYYLRAERSTLLADLREYQEKYPDGQFQGKIATRIAALESRALERVVEQPTRDNIRQFAETFPESERLSLVKQAAENRAENREELVSAVEEAYVVSAKARPSAKIVAEYLREFPKRDSLDAVANAAASKPEVMSEVQPALEEAYLKKMEQNLTVTKAEEFLDKFPEPVRKEKFEEVVAKKPEVRRRAVRKMLRIQQMKQVKQD